MSPDELANFYEEGRLQVVEEEAKIRRWCEEADRRRRCDEADRRRWWDPRLVAGARAIDQVPSRNAHVQNSLRVQRAVMIESRTRSGLHERSRGSNRFN